MNFELSKQVSRKSKPMAKFYTRLLLVLSILFVLMGIVLDRGMLLLSMLSVLLYWYSSYESSTDYEYHLEGTQFTVDVIKGKMRRKRVQELDLENLEVIAPNWHDAVGKYRKKGGTVRLKKYDYTSYEDDIPFYTMIIQDEGRKIKLLLDLDDEWLRMLKRKYPTKVVME